jgi:hypothetical protein
MQLLTQKNQDVDMLLTAEPKDIDFRYFFLRKSSIEHAPHLFIDGSPLLILAPALQNADDVQDSLERSGVDIVLAVNQLVTQLLQDIELKHGGTGSATTFKDLQKTMMGRFSEADVAKYKGYDDADAYHNVSGR